MHNSHLSLFLGLTTVAVLGAPLPAKAATFNYDSLQLIPFQPIASNSVLQFSGSPSDNQGFTAFFNLDFSAPDRGHFDISLNSPNGIAPYYTTGRQSSPEQPPSGATRSASLGEVVGGFSNFSNYLQVNNISLESIGLGYGQKSDRDFRKTWNLGDDLLGKNWLASPDYNVEERIYAANPDDVEIFLSYGTTKLINFGYSNFYTIFDYGATPTISDDLDIIFTSPLSAEKATGLDPLASSLADAFLQDVAGAGGGVQVVYEEAQVPNPQILLGNGFIVAPFSFPFKLSAVALESKSVPEPTAIIGLSVIGIWGAISRKKNRKNA
jgi:hypothetical protein